MEYLARAPVLVLAALLLLALGYLGAPYVSGDHHPQNCNDLPELEVVVSIDDPTREASRQCLDPAGNLVNDTLTGTIAEETPPAEEVP